MSAQEFVEWLGIIPNRHWLVLGNGLAEAIRETSQPSAVTVLPADEAAELPFETGTFDVVVLAGDPSSAAIREIRRVLWPAGIAAVLSPGRPSELERLFRSAGLHAIQTCELGARATR
jgi:SAM-dependent methyltransferase